MKLSKLVVIFLFSLIKTLECFEGKVWNRTIKICFIYSVPHYFEICIWVYNLLREVGSLETNGSCFAMQGRKCIPFELDWKKWNTHTHTWKKKVYKSNKLTEHRLSKYVPKRKYFIYYYYFFALFIKTSSDIFITWISFLLFFGMLLYFFE